MNFPCGVGSKNHSLEFGLFIYLKVKVELATVVEGHPKASFSVATTVGEGATPFSRLLHFTLDTYLIMLC